VADEHPTTTTKTLAHCATGYCHITAIPVLFPKYNCKAGLILMQKPSKSAIEFSTFLQEFCNYRNYWVGIVKICIAFLSLVLCCSSTAFSTKAPTGKN
jgi:hypothetical protein